MIDIEEIVTAYLVTVEAIDDLGAEIVPETPDSVAAPWVRVTQLDAVEVTHQTERAHQFMVQFDCYAGADGGQVEASALARAVRAAVAAIGTASHIGAALFRPRFVGHGRFPDPDFEPARERYIVTAEITGHGV